MFQLANVPSSNNPPDVPPVAGGFPDAAEPQHRPFLRRRGSASDSDPTIEPAVRTCSRKVASGIEPFQGYSIDDTREPPGHQPQRRWSRPYRLRIQVVIATLRRPKHYNAGLDLEGQGRFEEAIAEYDMAISSNPRFAQAFNNRGGLYGRLGDLQSAIEDFDEAIRLDPQYALAYFNRGLAYNATGEAALADADFARAAELGADVEELLNQG